ncbi:DUF6308 family protein [Streptomyces hyaluromycini]|uniref:DUF6308 family protein n=1 Tax=Streptomyces hyaluromycini TaxID=1377993 RepID=A0ABV1X0Q7_9ACTN
MRSANRALHHELLALRQLAELPETVGVLRICDVVLWMHHRTDQEERSCIDTWIPAAAEPSSERRTPQVTGVVRREIGTLVTVTAPAEPFRRVPVSSFAGGGSTRRSRLRRGMPWERYARGHG